MIKPLDTRPYGAVFVLDSQLALEARPLDTIQWQDLDAQAPILLLVMPQMLSEVDSKKRDGRLGERARAFNRLVEPCTQTGLPHGICKQPEVDIALCAVKRINWDTLDDLDPQQGDDRIVAEALNARISEPERLSILSYDTRPRAAAQRHGLAARKPPESWILPPEPGPQQKEMTRLKQRLQQFEAVHPQIAVQFSHGFDLPLPVLSVAPVDKALHWVISKAWMDRNPARSHGWMPLDNDAGYDRRYQDFEDATKAYPEALHTALQTVHSQYRILFELENSGHIAADHLEISISAQGARLFEKLILSGVMPPIAPEYDPHWLTSHLGNLPMFGKPGRTDVAYDPEPERGNSMRLTCKDFRQGRKWEGEIFVAIDPEAATPARLTATVTARNLPGRVETAIELPFAVSAKNAVQLFDIKALQPKVRFPLQDFLASLPEETASERVEFQSED